MSLSVGIKLLFLTAVVFQHVGSERVDRPGSGRQERSLLIFPPDSLLQITVGITSSGYADRNSAAIALAFQQNAPLPTEPQLLAGRGFSIYEHLENVIARYGFDGAECLGKMICQTAETPLIGGLLEDVVSFVLTPSKHRSTNRNAEDIDFLLESESLGRSGGNCSSSFPRCARSPLDLVSSLARVAG